MASRKRLRDWGQPRARSAEASAAVAADPEPAHRPPGRKDKRQWCRGKEGVTHQPTIVTGKDDAGLRCEWAGCHDYWLIRRGEDGSSVRWLCWHRQECSACGRILRERWHLDASECPAYPGDEGQRAEAEREAAAYPERWRAWAARNGRPGRVITGPQGYRRKREGAS